MIKQLDQTGGILPNQKRRQWCGEALSFFFFFIVAQYFSLNKYHLINNCNVQNAYS